MGGALEGTRVVELGTHLAAPLTGLLLAEHGADVVHVARPGARERARHAVHHRGKRRVVLDLETPEGQATARRLAARADVLIDGSRPGALAGRGVDTAALRAEHPGLITCALPGFAADDPRSRLPAWEGVVGALSGIYELPLAPRPRYTRLPLASLGASWYAVNGIAAALYARERDGRGQHVEVPLYDATFALQELTALFTVRPPSSWRTLQWAASPFQSAWPCREGAWVYLHAGLDRHLARLLHLLEEHGHADEVRVLRDTITPDTAHDPSAVGSVREALALRGHLGHLFRQRTAADWEQLLGGAGLCAVRVRSAREWLHAPEARQAGLAVTVQDPHLGATLQPGPAVRLSATPAVVRPRAAEATDPEALLAAWPPRPAAPPVESPDRAPYTGLRVLDLTQVIAGPLAGRTLAELGAEVLHIENPRLHAAWVQPFHGAFGAGKRSVSLDLQRPGDRAVFWDLVERFAPDVVLHSLRPGPAARLGLDEATFREQVPGVVYVRVSAWGERGPWAGRPGWEQTVQAATGVQAERGGDGPPDLLPIPFHDLGTGLLAAYGTGLALLHRRRTGTPQRVGASLAATSGLAQSAWLFEPGGPPPPGRDALGSGPLHRFYEARDGWLFLAAPPDILPDLARVPGLEGVYSALDRGAVLEQAFATAAVSVWQARIAAAGLDHRVAVVRRTRPVTAMDDPHAQARDLVRRRFHAEVGEVTETGPPLRLSGTPCEYLGPAPPRGADTRPELERLGIGVPRDAPPPEVERPEPPARSPTRELAWAWNQARWGIALAVGRLPPQSVTGLHLRERLLRSLS